MHILKNKKAMVYFFYKLFCRDFDFGDAMYLGSLNCLYKLSKVVKLEARYFYSIIKGILVNSRYFTKGYKNKKKTLDHFYKLIQSW